MTSRFGRNRKRKFLAELQAQQEACQQKLDKGYQDLADAQKQMREYMRNVLDVQRDALGQLEYLKHTIVHLRDILGEHFFTLPPRQQALVNQIPYTMNVVNATTLKAHQRYVSLAGVYEPSTLEYIDTVHLLLQRIRQFNLHVPTNALHIVATLEGSGDIVSHGVSMHALVNASDELINHWCETLLLPALRQQLQTARNRYSMPS